MFELLTICTLICTLLQSTAQAPAPVQNFSTLLPRPVWNSDFTDLFASGAYSFSADLLQPMLLQPELVTMQYLVRGKIVVEYGSGGSTVSLAAVASKLFSIECQQLWCAALLERIDIQFWIQNNVLTHACVDIGPTGPFGYPTMAVSPHTAFAYVNAISRFDVENIEVVIVDGRYRVASALNSLSYLSDNGLVIVHDFVPRQHYYVVLKYFNEVFRVATMVVLEKRTLQGHEQQQLQRDLRHYLSDPR